MVPWGPLFVPTHKALALTALHRSCSVWGAAWSPPKLPEDAGPPGLGKIGEVVDIQTVVFKDIIYTHTHIYIYNMH